MHHSECRRPYPIANLMTNPHDPSTCLQIANVFYEGLDVFSCTENDEARKAIVEQGIHEKECPQCCFL